MSTDAKDATAQGSEAGSGALPPRSPPQVLVHFYRAGVQHADVWRQRLDSTTNWAVVTTAAVITFAFGGPNSPHFVLLLALVFDFFFLFMESRRYQMYNLWQRRIRALHQYLVAPALRRPEDVDADDVQGGFDHLAADLGVTVPRIPLWGAVGYRIRRNYGPLVTIVILTWGLKLYIHPFPAGSWDTLVVRAGVGLVPGPFVLAGVWLFFGSFVYLAVKAPSEQMRDWSLVPAPIERIVPVGRRVVSTRKPSGEDVPDEAGPSRRPGGDRESGPEGAEGSPA